MLIEKKSKFISYVFTISSPKEATCYIEKIRKDHKDARHIVYIYSLLNGKNEIIQYSDNGEPRGTGTKAIYKLLTKERITNVCIVIVRYFGGILLGTGPLSRAYLNTTKMVLHSQKKILLKTYTNFFIKITYPKYDKLKTLLENLAKNNTVILKSIDYKEFIELSIDIDSECYDSVISNIKSIII
ncbi:MAG: YigZ family protein [Clostridia bacterium]